MAFWGWSSEQWTETIGSSSDAFRRQTRRGPDIRKQLIVAAYLLCDFSRFDRIGQVNLVTFAALVFGNETVDAAVRRVTDELHSWGYSGARLAQGSLPSALCEALLVNRSPRLEDVTTTLLEQLRANSIAETHKESLVSISKALAKFRIIKQALPPGTASRRQLGIGGAFERVHPEWVLWVQRWVETTTYANKTAAGYVYSLLGVGRWLFANHPEVTSPADWTRDLAIEYVAVTAQMTSCEWAHSGIRHASVGKPLSPRTRFTRLCAVRAFFSDLQEWEWIPRRFDVRRAFATPRDVRAGLGPAPRTMSDDVWAKLLWAGLNIGNDDLPMSIASRGPGYPLEMVMAIAAVWLLCGLRHNEIKRLRVGCVRLEEMNNGNGEEAMQVCWLDVPVSKTGGEFTKPVDRAVGEAVRAWEALRPQQPALLDRKTGEMVHFVFCFRGRSIGESYINGRLIPLLCRKAGVPEEDARGAITSHRARATITSQLYNAREPMSIWDLKEWLGHRRISSTEHYVRTSPTRLAKAYQEAGYFERNRRLIDVLVDQDAVRSGSSAEGRPWRYYDLGHGYCAYDFFDQCPHRMACARCDFYVPKESTHAQLLEGKANLVRMKQEIPLTDEEVAAIDDGIAMLERLRGRLDDKPTPAGPTPRELRRSRSLPIHPSHVR
jgi:integrase